MYYTCQYFYPGPDYLKRICKDQDGLEPVKILTASEVYVHLQQNKEVNSWIGCLKDYLMNVNGQLMNDKNLVFFIESQVFLTNTTPQRPISVMVSIVLPLAVLHNTVLLDLYE